MMESLKINGVECIVSNGLVIDDVVMNNSNIKYTIDKLPVEWTSVEA